MLYLLNSSGALFGALSKHLSEGCGATLASRVLGERGDDQRLAMRRLEAHATAA
jgi:hypothetical protein